MANIFDFVLRLVKWRALRYIISGGTGAVVNLVVLFVCVHFLNMWYILAAIVAFVVAFFVSFTLQKFFTFNDYDREKFRQQSAVYLVIQIFNLGVNALLLYISVDMLHIHYLISQFIVLGIVAFYSFFLFKRLVFTTAVNYNKTQ